MPAAWLRSAACALNVIPVQSIFKPRFAFRVSRIGKVFACARCCRGEARPEGSRFRAYCHDRRDLVTGSS